MNTFVDARRARTGWIGVQKSGLVFKRVLIWVTVFALSVVLCSYDTISAQTNAEWLVNSDGKPPILTDNEALIIAGAEGSGDDILDSSHAAPLSLSFAPAQLIAAEGGLIVERQAWQFDGVTGSAWRARTALPGRIRVIPSSGVSRFAQFIPDDPGPWAIINGGFYDVDGRAMGVVVADGETFSPFRRGGGSGVFQVTQEGPRIIHRSEFKPGVIQALQSIDRIIDNGRSLVNPRLNARSTARAAVVITDKELIFVVVAQDESVSGKGDDVRLGITSRLGLPLWAFSDYLLRSTGAREALNLDGSVSTQFAARLAGRDIRVRGVRGTVNALIMRPN